MNSKEQKKIQDLFNNSSTALSLLESEIRQYVQTPNENIDIKKFQLIGFPSNYIRRKEYFIWEFRIDEITNNQTIRDNIAYALMQSDLYNYLINRIAFWGVIRNLLIKTAITNITSIIEAMLICTIELKHDFCKPNGIICKHNRNCKNYIKSPKSVFFNDAIEIFEHKFLRDNPDVIKSLKKLKSIRNNIHLTLVQENEFKKSDYTLGAYNESIKLLEFFKKNLSLIKENFETERGQNCKLMPNN